MRLRPLLLVLFAVLVAAPAAEAVTVERVRSPGGVEAWLVRDDSVPLVSIRFAFRGGTRLEPDGREGLANLLSSLLDEGAAELDAQAFQRRLEDISMQLSFSAGRDTFRGSARILNEFRDEGVRLLRLALTEPRFEAEAIARIRSSVVAGIRREQEDPNYIASQAFFQTVFAGHPYARPVRGTVDSVGAATAEDMRAFVRRQFARDRLVVSVVGDIDAAALAPLLDRAFGALPAAGAPIEVPEAELKGAGKVLVTRKAIPQAVVVFGEAGLKRADPDFYAAYVMNYILGGGGFSSRLAEEVREKRGLTYSVYSYLAPLDRAALIMGGVATQSARTKESLDVIRAEWARMRDHGATAAELADAKTYLNGSFALRLDSTGAIADLLTDVQLDELGIDYLDKRAGYISAVTLDDVARVARRLLDPAKLTVSIVGSPDGIDATN